MSSLIHLMCQAPARVFVNLSGTPTNPNIMATTVVNDPNPPTTIFSGWQFDQFGVVKQTASHDGSTLVNDIFRPDIEWIDPTYRTGGFLPGAIVGEYYLRATTVSGSPPFQDGEWQELGFSEFAFGKVATITWVASSFDFTGTGYIPDTPPVTKEGVCKVEISTTNDGSNILAVGYYGGGVTWTAV